MNIPHVAEKHKVCTVASGKTPMCACKPGYVEVDGWGCVDETPPLLKLRHDPEANGINRIIRNIGSFNLKCSTNSV